MLAEVQRGRQGVGELQPPVDPLRQRVQRGDRLLRRRYKPAPRLTAASSTSQYQSRMSVPDQKQHDRAAHDNDQRQGSLVQHEVRKLTPASLGQQPWRENGWASDPSG